MNQILEGVREYCENYPVKIETDEDNGRLVVIAYNEAGGNSTAIDLLDLISWLKNNRPEILI